MSGQDSIAYWKNRCEHCQFFLETARRERDAALKEVDELRDKLRVAVGLIPSKESARCEARHPVKGTQCGLPAGHNTRHQNGTIVNTWE